jgi:hypothetical protein
MFGEIIYHLRVNILNKKELAEAVRSYLLGHSFYFVDNNSKINFNRNGKIDTMRDLTELYSKKVLVLLTESPNFNFFDWCSDTYEKEYNVKKQVYRGFKEENEWTSVISQMLIAFFVMFKNKFTISDMEIKHNFYIKEVMGYTRDSTQYWRYTINLIDYYIPNYGSLLLIDSNFRDLDPKDKFKILSTDLGDDELLRTLMEKDISKDSDSYKMKK